MNLPKRTYLSVKNQTQLKYITQYKIILGNQTFLNGYIIIYKITHLHNKPLTLRDVRTLKGAHIWA